MASETKVTRGTLSQARDGRLTDLAVLDVRRVRRPAGRCRSERSELRGRPDTRPRRSGGTSRRREPPSLQYSAAMRVRVLFFAGLREAIGEKEFDLEIDPPLTLGELLARLRREHPAVERYNARLIISLNEE